MKECVIEHAPCVQVRDLSAQRLKVKSPACNQFSLFEKYSADELGKRFIMHIFWKELALRVLCINLYRAIAQVSWQRHHDLRTAHGIFFHVDLSTVSFDDAAANG